MSRGLGAQPRLRFATLPTPVQEAPRLRAALGGPERCPRILIKRDDLTGLAFGGNKARKLEFLVADALRAGATRLITAGAAQSNHARMTAAAARVAGLEATLVLTTKDERPAMQENLLLDRLLGAEVRLIPHGADEEAAMTEVADTARARGERPYVIPVGGSNAIGTLGYVAATLELEAQLFAAGESPSALYYASGSRGTQVGLVLGAKLHGASYRVHGIAVSPGEEEKRARAIRIAGEAAALLGTDVRLTDDDLSTDEGQIGEGYGIPTPAGLEAIALLARQEAIFLDPVYSAKGLAGLIGDIRRGNFDPADTVLFLHTGGADPVFASRSCAPATRTGCSSRFRQHECPGIFPWQSRERAVQSRLPGRMLYFAPSMGDCTGIEPGRKRAEYERTGDYGDAPGPARAGRSDREASLTCPRRRRRSRNWRRSAPPRTSGTIRAPRRGRCAG